MHASEQERADVAQARERWRQDQPSFDPARLVFLDETGTSTNMIRTRGRSQRGTRLISRVPHGHWKITTFVAGLRYGEITAPFVIDRPMNGAIFLAGACPGEGRGPPMPGPDPDHRRHRRHG